MQIVYTPPEVGKLTVDALSEIRDTKNGGIRTGIKPIDEYLLPMRSGELISIIGYTSWYKSGLMNAITRSALTYCGENECVVKATWEQSVEEDTVSWIANESGIGVNRLIMGEYDNWEAIMQGYSKRIVTPLWIVGHSTVKSAQERIARPRMTMTDVAKACNYISNEATDNQIKIRMIILDYLQRMRPDPNDGGTKREQMMEAVNKAKDLSFAYGCPVILGVQSSREPLNREYKLPRLDDGQETSNIEQSSDKILSVWYPIKTEEKGTLINGVEVNENLLICGILKQKFGIAPMTFNLYVDPSRNIIKERNVLKL